MEYTIPIPDDVALQIKNQWPDIPRRALEAFALQAYRNGVITEYEVQKLLKISSRMERRAKSIEQRAESGERKSELKEKDEHRTSNTRLPCITNDGGMIIVTGPRHQDILPRPPKGIAGRSNVQHRMKK